MDRIREALFSILGQSLCDRCVLDLFSGSGALGIEALSRGAGRVVFVEQDNLCVDCIVRNLEQCGFSSQGTVFRCRLPDELPSVARRIAGQVDIVLMDPPYGWCELDALLSGLVRCSLLADRATIVFEHFHKAVFAQMLPPFSLVKQKRYGRTTLSFFQYFAEESGHGER